VPKTIFDLFALTVVVEQRALRRYQQHMRREDVSERTREVLEAVTKDEAWHIDWIRTRARVLAEQSGDPDSMERALKRYRAIDEEVMAELDEKERTLGD
jgi:rubrerythrin